MAQTTQSLARDADGAAARSPVPNQTKVLPHPWRQLCLFDALESTQVAAAGLVDSGRDPYGTILWADRQTGGRGRMGRPWLSCSGGLYVTACLPFQHSLKPSQVGCYALAGALSCVESLRRFPGVEAQIKWPNDVFLQGRKVAGLLGEIRQRPCCDEKVVLLGMGLNWVNDLPTAFMGNGFAAVSVGEFRPGLTLQAREPFLIRWIGRLAQWLSELQSRPEPTLDDLKAAVEAVLWRRGEPVSFKQTEQGNVEGILEELGPDGSARLRRHDGSLIDVYCGWQAAGSPNETQSD